MRYDKRITIVGASEEVFNAQTGNTDIKDGESVTLPCNVTKMPLTRQKEIFGTLDYEVLIIRLQRPYTKFINHVLYKDNKLDVININDYRSETTIYVKGKAVRVWS